MAKGSKNLVVGAWQKFIAGLRALWQWVLREVNLLVSAPGRWLWRLLKGTWRALARFVRWIVLLPLLLVVSVIHWAAGLTLRRIWSIAWRGAVALGIVMAVSFFALVHWPHSQVPDLEPPDQVVYLDQGWGNSRDSADRQAYYYTPQGAGQLLRGMRYDWIVHLEQPWGKQRLTDPDQMRAYGFQVDNAATPDNLHRLPVGFTRHYDPALNEYVLDITCATCHTGSLLVPRPDGSRVSLRIDGGQAMHAISASKPPHFIPVLVASMVSTYVNPFKFRRFAENVLGPEHDRAGRKALRRQFGTVLGDLMQFARVQFPLGVVEEGYARTDALTRIANEVFGHHITPDNYKAITAPVSYPAVWDIWKFDWVQYSASVAQPMARNLGESLGVGAAYAFTDPYGRPLPEDQRYRTTTQLVQLHEIETLLQKLRPPAWPEDILGKVDRDKAVRGGIAFIRTCQGCHGPHPASDRQRTIEMPGKNEGPGAPLPHWRLKTLPVQEIGTDPLAAVNFVELTFDLTPTGLSTEEVKKEVGEEIRQRIQRELDWDFAGGPEKGYCSPLDTDFEEYVPASFVDRATCEKAHADQLARQLDAIDLEATTNGQGLNYFGLLMKKKMYAELDIDEEQQKVFNGFDALDLPQVGMIYKARPLAGAWATAPYLHNGSVRNLYQLLSPQHERDAKFFMGRPEFDPVSLGIARGDAKEGGWWFDTAIPGNANTGHEFRAGYTQWRKGSPPQYGVIGAEYSHDERMEIIEYVKSHLDDPPHSPLFSEVFRGVVAEVMRTLPDDAAAIPSEWPQGQACNLREYLKNQDSDTAIDAQTAENIATILERLDAYFSSGRNYQCGGETRFQRGG